MVLNSNFKYIVVLFGFLFLCAQSIYSLDCSSGNYSPDKKAACEACDASLIPSFNSFAFTIMAAPERYWCATSTPGKHIIYDVLDEPTVTGYTNDNNPAISIELCPYGSTACDDGNAEEHIILAENKGPNHYFFYEITNDGSTWNISVEHDSEDWMATYEVGEEPTDSTKEYEKTYWELIQEGVTQYQYDLRRFQDPNANLPQAGEIWESQIYIVYTSGPNEGKRFVNYRKDLNDENVIVGKIIPACSNFEEDCPEAGIYMPFYYDHFTTEYTEARVSENVVFYGYNCAGYSSYSSCTADNNEGRKSDLYCQPVVNSSPAVEPMKVTQNGVSATMNMTIHNTSQEISLSPDITLGNVAAIGCEE